MSAKLKSAKKTAPAKTAKAPAALKKAAPAPKAAAPKSAKGGKAAELPALAAAGGGGEAAIAAAAGGSTEMSASFKNFRHHPDMENFYRFIFDNDLRHEALAIIDQIMVEKAQRRALKQAKVHAH